MNDLLKLPKKVGVKEINFIHPDIMASRYSSNWFVQDATGLSHQSLHFIDPTWSSMAQVVAYAGCFKSISEARKNGWNIPIPQGVTEHYIGTLGKPGLYKVELWVCNKVPGQEYSELVDIELDGSAAYHVNGSNPYDQDVDAIKYHTWDYGFFAEEESVRTSGR